jgi:hypothetical protein
MMSLNDEEDAISVRKRLEDNELTIDLDDDLRRYLGFLERIKNIKNKEEAALAALRIYKKLNMHDWLPYVYRSGTERLLIVDHGTFNDILSTMSESRLYDVARATALKRKVLRSADPNLDLTSVDNWGIILSELENLGWGRFTRDGNEILVEYLGVPLTFLRGYLESLFRVEFQTHVVKGGELIILRPV